MCHFWGMAVFHIVTNSRERFVVHNCWFNLLRISAWFLKKAFFRYLNLLFPANCFLFPSLWANDVTQFFFTQTINLMWWHDSYFLRKSTLKWKQFEINAIMQPFNTKMWHFKCLRNKVCLSIPIRNLKYPINNHEFWLYIIFSLNMF